MNPFVPEEQANALLALYPDMPHFPSPQGVKIPAAWLIEQ
jgi:UDP-N-acetylmuramate dehydrogenase